MCRHWPAGCLAAVCGWGFAVRRPVLPGWGFCAALCGERSGCDCGFCCGACRLCGCPGLCNFSLYVIKNKSFYGPDRSGEPYFRVWCRNHPSVLLSCRSDCLTALTKKTEESHVRFGSVRFGSAATVRLTVSGYWYGPEPE